MINDNVPLIELSKKFFNQKFDYREPESVVKGRSGHKWKFDGVIDYKDQKFGIIVRDWNRSIGVNQVRQLEKACRDTNCDGGILVGSIFSANAEMFADNLGIQLLDRVKLMKKLRNSY